jgi:hypothetical protein
MTLTAAYAVHITQIITGKIWLSRSNHVYISW